MSYHLLITIDVEDWFQVENFKQFIPFSSWPSYALRVEKNIHRILDLLDSQSSGVSSQQSVSTNLYPARPVGPADGTGVKSGGYLTGATNSINPIKPSDSLRRRRIFTPCNARPVEREARSTGAEPISQGELSQFLPETEKKEKSSKSSKSCLTEMRESTTEHPESSKSCLRRMTKASKSCLTKNSPKATFFVLGWIAQRLPHLVREIHTRGHEVASHGCSHNLCNEQSIDDLRKDLSDSKKVLEDIVGAPVFGYRAPSFSISDDILKIIEECGYLYDSSFNSFGMHGRYGRATLSGNVKKGIAVKISNNFYELPISNFRLWKRVFPLGGGGYFRLIPFPFFKLGVRSLLNRQQAYVFYMHPWEIDPEQPKVKEASVFYKFRHYYNLSKTYSKLSQLIESFEQCSFITCRQYVGEMVTEFARH